MIWRLQSWDPYRIPVAAAPPPGAACVEVAAKRRDLLCLTATAPWTDDRIRFDAGTFEGRMMAWPRLYRSSFPVFLRSLVLFALLLLLICLLGSSSSSNFPFYLILFIDPCFLFFRYGSFALFPSLGVGASSSCRG
jgi:hypothetical protein